MRLVLAILSISLLLNAETANAQDNMSASEGIQSYLYGSEFASSVVNGQPVPYGQDSAPANSLWIQDQNQQIQHMQSSMLDQLKLVAYSTGGSAIMTEVYPDGRSAQNYYYFQPGYNEVVFAPDVPGRHTLGYEVDGQLSNVVTIDVIGEDQAGSYQALPYQITLQQSNEGQDSTEYQQKEFDVGPGESIQAAIDASNPGDVVWVKPGSYYEHINIDKPILLEGWIDDEHDPTSYPVVDAGGMGSAITISADGVIVESFKVMNSDDSGIKISSNDNIIAQIVAENNLYGFYLEFSKNNSFGTCFPRYNRYGIYVDSSNDNELEGISSEHNDVGLFFKYSDNNRFLYSDSITNDTYGIYLDESKNNMFRNLVVADCIYGIYLIDSFDNKIYENVLCDNLVYNAYDNGSNQWYVWDEVSERNDGNFYGTCRYCQGNDSCHACYPWDGCFSGAPHGGLCDNSYYIPGGQNVDNHPWVECNHYSGWSTKHKKHK